MSSSNATSISLVNPSTGGGGSSPLPTDLVRSNDIRRLVSITRTDYDNLAVKDPTVAYFVTD